MSQVHWYSRRLVFIVAFVVAIGLSLHVRANAPPDRYTIGNGTVLDIKTGLLWQQPIGSKRNWTDATTHCGGLSLDGKTGWRLPSVKELQTIVDEKQLPPIDANAFPNTPTEDFWTSSLDPANPSYAWYVGFVDGDSFSRNMTTALRVRCVR